MSQKANATVTTQFRKIIMFMKRQSANSKDPRVTKLFKILNSQFNMMQKETGVNPDSDDESKNTPNDDGPANTAPNEDAPNEDAPNEDAPNEDAPNEYAPNEYEPNEYEPNEYEPNEYEPNEYEPNEDAENITSVMQDLMSSMQNAKQ